MADDLEIDVPYTLARSMIRIADEASYDHTANTGYSLDADVRQAIERMGNPLVDAFDQNRAALNTLFGVAPRDNTAVTITVEPDVLTAYLNALDTLYELESIYHEDCWYVAETLIENAGDEFDTDDLDLSAVPIDLPTP